MPLGELAAVRTRVCDSDSGIVPGLKTRTEATRCANFSIENLNEFRSSGLLTKRSAFGYSSKIRSIIDGPVNSNRRAPPTKQIAILDRVNSPFRLAAVESGDDACFSAAPPVAKMAEEEAEKKKRKRERDEKSKRRNRQSRLDTIFVKCIVFRGLPSMFAFAYTCPTPTNSLLAFIFVYSIPPNYFL